MKKECTPDFGEESDLWNDVAACGDTDIESDMSNVVISDDVGACAHYGSLERNADPSALLSSKPKDKEPDLDAGKLWDPNHGELRGLDGFLVVSGATTC